MFKQVDQVCEADAGLTLETSQTRWGGNFAKQKMVFHVLS